MKEILLKQNKLPCLVSDKDYDYLNQFVWNVRVGRKTLYAVRVEKGKQITMHSEIMKTESGAVIDHKDLNGLNNQRENLRIATYSENMVNRTKFGNGTSQYKGVCRIKKGGWQVSLKSKGIIYKKYAKEEVDAAIKYNELAKLHHGEFAQLNIISEEQINLYLNRLKIPNQDSKTQKTCRKCKKTKLRTEFSKDKNRTDNYNTYCKKCEKERKRLLSIK